MMQISVGLHRTAQDTEVLHTVQLLDLAYQREDEEEPQTERGRG